VVVDPSGQTWFKKFYLGEVPFHFDQPEEQKRAIFEAPSDRADRTEGEQVLPDHQRG
jgi:hypothetical protein